MTEIFTVLLQFAGVSVLAVLAVATSRCLWDLVINGEQLVREKREAGEETVYAGMYVRDGKVIVKTRKRKNLWLHLWR